jgi:hypothetical protein
MSGQGMAYLSAQQIPPLRVFSDGSRTVPIGTAKMQVNDSVDLGGHNKNRSPSVQGPHFSI